MSPIEQSDLDELFSYRRQVLLRFLFNIGKVVGSLVLVSPIITGSYDSPGEWAKLIVGICGVLSGVFDAGNHPTPMKPISLEDLKEIKAADESAKP